MEIFRYFVFFVLVGEEVLVISYRGKKYMEVKRGLSRNCKKICKNLRGVILVFFIGVLFVIFVLDNGGC